MAKRISPLILEAISKGFRERQGEIKDLAKTATDSSKAVQSGTAHAWTPYISSLQKARAEQRAQLNDAKAVAAGLEGAAKRAEAAAEGASSTTRRSMRQRAADARQAADAEIVKIKQLEDEYRNLNGQIKQAQSAANRQVAGGRAPTNGPIGVAAPTSTGGAPINSMRANLTERLTNIGAATYGASVIKSYSASIAEAGANAVETQNLIRESFGSSTADIQAWGDNLHSTLGLNSLAAQQNAGVFNVMFNSMGLGEKKALDMSKGLTVLANDMASFYNISPEEAFTKLSAGITGEMEPLRRLGILVDEQTIKNYAYANGIATQGAELSQQEKVLARYGAIMAQTGKAQGDLARTMESPANVARRLDATLTTASQNMGQGAAYVRGQWQSAALTIVEGMNNSASGVESFVGGVVEAASVTSSALTPLYNLSQVALAIRDSQNLAKIATLESAAATELAGDAALAANIKMMPMLLTIGKIGAVAIISGIALYALDKAMHWREDKALRENIAKGDEADQQYYEIEKQGWQKKGQPVLSYEEWRKKTGRGQEDTDDKDKQPDFEALQKQFDATTAGNAGPPATSYGAGAVTPNGVSFTPSAMPSTASGDVSTGAPDNGVVGAAGVTDGPNPYGDQIRALQRRKRDLKGKGNAAARDALQHQIDSLQDSQRSSKEANKEAKRIQREAAKAEKVQDRDDLELAKAKSDIEAAGKIDALEEQLAQAKGENNDQEIGQLTAEITKARAEKEYNDKIFAASQLDAGKHRKTQEDIAKLERDADLKRAETAGNKAAASAERGDSGKKRPLSPHRVAELFRATAWGGGASTSRGFTILNPAAAESSDRYQNAGNALTSWNNSMGYLPTSAPENARNADLQELSGSLGAAPMVTERDGLAISVLKSLAAGGQVGGGYTGSVRGVPPISGFDKANRDQMQKERRIRVKSITRGKKEDTVKFVIDDLKIPREDPFGGWDGDG